MSQQGIKYMAGVFEHLQNARHHLISMATEAGKSVDKTDLALGQLLDTMKDAGKDEFMAIISGKFEQKPKKKKKAVAR